LVESHDPKKVAAKKEAMAMAASKAEEEKKEEMNSKNWSQEEINELTKAIQKFPAGTGDRWKVISQEVGKTQKEVITKAKDIAARQ